MVVAEWGAIFALFSVGLFWAVNSYAIGVGTSRDQQIERELATTADAVVYSQQSLDLQVPGVREVVCSGPATASDPAYRYRYEGLKLILQSGGQYLFLPATWNPRDGVALVIPRSDALQQSSTPGQGDTSHLLKADDQPGAGRRVAAAGHSCDASGQARVRVASRNGGLVVLVPPAAQRARHGGDQTGRRGEPSANVRPSANGPEISCGKNCR